MVSKLHRVNSKIERSKLIDKKKDDDEKKRTKLSPLRRKPSKLRLLRNEVARIEMMRQIEET